MKKIKIDTNINIDNFLDKYNLNIIMNLILLNLY